MIEAAAKREMEFQTLATEVLGENRAETINAFTGVLRESLGDKAHLASKISNMSNEELLPLIVLSKNIHDKYTGENKVIIGADGTRRLSGDLKADFQNLSQQKVAIKTDEKMAPHIKKMKLVNLNLQMQRVGTQAKNKGINLFA